MPVACPQCKTEILEQALQASGGQTSCAHCKSLLQISSMAPPTVDVGGTALNTQQGSLAVDKKYALEVIDGNEPGKVIPIEKAYVIIGRRDCDIALDDPEISRKHVMLTIEGATAKMEDLDSTNGTYIDGLRVKQETLKDGSVFRLGTHQLVFQVTDR